MNIRFQTFVLCSGLSKRDIVCTKAMSRKRGSQYAHARRYLKSNAQLLPFTLVRAFSRTDDEILDFVAQQGFLDFFDQPANCIRPTLTIDRQEIFAEYILERIRPVFCPCSLGVVGTNLDAQRNEPQKAPTTLQKHLPINGSKTQSYMARSSKKRATYLPGVVGRVWPPYLA
ncbi:hypothetical protein VFPPC_17599 [Pochonia chlamydosporia 170]|uniref:Uncharacterized protein n=1 Tax=Pochonia chlamydosporia 170 TaxID=1380566 RepID=A0A219AR28_METCM|nr:hypothetical protein VFPPC_17599 [Pochonia chlamydosporia 170]OWT43238.1 hypothetical protein VFPPC_17599 [Pochonia chlamydosporia 170]